MMKDSGDEFNQVVKDLAQSTEEQTKALTENLQQQIDTLTQGIQEALTQSLTTLGGQLSALTQKFASDYGQTAKELENIQRTTTQINNRLNRGNHGEKF